MKCRRLRGTDAVSDDLQPVKRSMALQEWDLTRHCNTWWYPSYCWLRFRQLHGRRISSRRKSAARSNRHVTVRSWASPGTPLNRCGGRWPEPVRREAPDRLMCLPDACVRSCGAGYLWLLLTRRVRKPRVCQSRLGKYREACGLNLLSRVCSFPSDMICF